MIKFSKKHNIFIGAHRGSRSPYPENTLHAIQYGNQFGVDYHEIDIQMTADGVIVLYHDTILSDGLGKGERIIDLEFSTLRSKYNNIETLENVLNWGKENEIFFLLELKTEPFYTRNHDIQMVSRLIHLLKKYDYIDKVVIFGLDYPLLAIYKQSEPSIRIGIIVPHVSHNPIQLMEETGAILYITFLKNLTPEIIQQVQSAGYYVSSSVVQTNEEKELVETYGIDMFDIDIYEEIPFKIN